MGDLLWPPYDGQRDVAAMESVPLTYHGLPGTTYELPLRAPAMWRVRTALSAVSDGARWDQPADRTYAELMVLDALPLTLVGTPLMPELCAEATREATTWRLELS